MRTALRSVALALVRTLNTILPESAWKNSVRATALRFRNALPRECMARDGDTVVQVGMWRSENLARLSKIVGAKGRVVLVEADPQVAARLSAFAKESKLPNITVVAKGAFHSKGRHTLRVGTSPTYNRLDGVDVKMMQEEFGGTREIEVDTVDNILAELGIERVDYIEITVNGIELQVLEGMDVTLPRTQRIFLSGYAHNAKDDTPTNRQTVEFLRQRNFKTRLTRRIAPAAIKYGELKSDWDQELLEGHVFAWKG